MKLFKANMALQNIYYIVISLFIIKMFTGHITCIDSIEHIINISGKLCIVISGALLLFIVCSDYFTDKKAFIRETILIVFFVVTGFLLTDIELAVTVAFILLCHDVKFDDIVKTYFYTVLTCIIVLFLLLIFGGANYYVQEATADEHMRRILGMNSNLLGGFITSTILAGWYLFFKDKLLLTFAICWPVATFIGFILVSRTGCVVLFLFPFICLLSKFFNRTYTDIKAFKVIICSLPIFNTLICIVLSYISPLFLGREYDSLRTFLNRFYVPYKLVQENGLSLLGGTLSHDDYFVLNMDCAYLRPFVYYGIIPGTIVLIGIILMLRKIYDNQRTDLMIIAIAFLIQGFMETYMIKVHFDWLLLALLADISHYDNKMRKSVSITHINTEG